MTCADCYEKHDPYYHVDFDAIYEPTDWRGFPIRPGAVVVYHVQTRGGKTVEGVVVEVTEGDPYRGKTIMVRPSRESCIAVGCQPSFYERNDKRLAAVPQYHVTVITAA